MAEIRNGITEQDKLAASKRLLIALEEGEQSAREKGWITADELEAELEHD
jgi:hypothetical protein